MGSTSQYNSLLAIASSNDKKQQICLEELKKIKTLREADNKMKESEKCEKERQERARRIYEYGLAVKEKNGENSLSNSLKVNDSKRIEKDPAEKRGRSMVYGSFFSVHVSDDVKVI